MKTVVELDVFVEQVEGRLSAEELSDLISYLSNNPDAGVLMQGAGGARKLRWGASGRGKSGGARIITYYHCDTCPVYLLDIYLKSEESTPTQSEIQYLKEACKLLAGDHNST